MPIQNIPQRVSIATNILLPSPIVQAKKYDGFLRRTY